MTSSTTERLPVELCDIGYDGTWEQFCNPEEIEKDFCHHPKHELRKVRIIICQLKKENKINRAALPALAVYKYCLVVSLYPITFSISSINQFLVVFLNLQIQMRPRIDEFLLELTSEFVQNDTEKRNRLLADGPIKNDTICFEKCLFKFSKICIEEKVMIACG